MKNLSISIPKPCHEDWKNMTPEQRGRFCGKCSKTVFDFSNKNMDEVKEYLAAHRNEKLCGRFRNDQLSQPVTIQIALQTSYGRLSPIQVFLMAALLAFGTTLFSCTTPHGETVGKLEIVEAALQKHTVFCKTGNNEVLGEVAYTIPGSDNGNDTMGKNQPAIQNFPVQGGILVCEIPVPGKEFIKGETVVSYNEIVTEPEDTLFQTLPVVEIEESISPEPISCITTGLIAIDIAFTSAPELIDPGSATENNKEALPASANDFNLIAIYPNPTNGLLSMEISMEKEEPVEADLYDVSGRHLSTLFTKKLMQPGRNSLQLTISGQPSGTYLVRIAGGNKTRIEKIVLEGR